MIYLRSINNPEKGKADGKKKEVKINWISQGKKRENGGEEIIKKK